MDGAVCMRSIWYRYIDVRIATFTVGDPGQYKHCRPIRIRHWDRCPLLRSAAASSIDLDSRSLPAVSSSRRLIPLLAGSTCFVYCTSSVWSNIVTDILISLSLSMSDSGVYCIWSLRSFVHGTYFTTADQLTECWCVGLILYLVFHRRG